MALPAFSHAFAQGAEAVRDSVQGVQDLRLKREQVEEAKEKNKQLKLETEKTGLELDEFKRPEETALRKEKVEDQSRQLAINKVNQKAILAVHTKYPKRAEMMQDMISKGKLAELTLNKDLGQNRAQYNLSSQYMAREAKGLNTPEDYARLSEKMTAITGESFPADPNVGLTSMAVMNEVFPHTFELQQELMLERAKERTALAKKADSKALQPELGTYQTIEGEVRNARQQVDGTVELEDENGEWFPAPSGAEAGVFQKTGQGEIFSGDKQMKKAYLAQVSGDEARAEAVAAEASASEAKKVMRLMENPEVMSGTGVSTLVEMGNLAKNIFALAGWQKAADSIDFSSEEQLRSSMAKFVMPFVKEQGRSFSDKDLQLFLTASAGIKTSKDANRVLARFTLVDSMDKIERHDFRLNSGYAAVGRSPTDDWKKADQNYRAYKKDFPRTYTHPDTGVWEVIQDDQQISRYYSKGRPKEFTLTNGQKHTIKTLTASAAKAPRRDGTIGMSLREFFVTLDKADAISEVTY
jgi:hypothetical protein